MRSLVRAMMYLAVISAVAGGLVWSFWPQPVLVELTAAARPLHVTVDEDGKTRVRERYVVAAPLAGRSAHRAGPGRPVTAGETCWPPSSPRSPNCWILAVGPGRSTGACRGGRAGAGGAAC